MEDIDINISANSSVQNCPFCHSEFLTDESAVSCRSCNAKHHIGCWDEHGMCSSCGGLESLAELRDDPIIQVTVKPTVTDDIDISVTANSGARNCPFCHAHLTRNETAVYCQACNAKHHAVCWNEHGNCSSCGESNYFAELRDESTPRRRQTQIPSLQLDFEPLLNSMGNSLTSLLGGNRSRQRRKRRLRHRSENRRTVKARPKPSPSKKKRGKDKDSMAFGLFAIAFFYCLVPVLFFLLVVILRAIF